MCTTPTWSTPIKISHLNKCRDLRKAATMFQYIMVYKMPDYFSLSSFSRHIAF